MSNQIEAKSGTLIKTAAGTFIVNQNGEFERQEPKRGPLGGELKRLGVLKEGDRVIVSGTVVDCDWRYKGNLSQIEIDNPFNDGKRLLEISHNCPVETNIPPRPTFTPMTAGEAAAIPGIVGRWVAVKITYIDNIGHPLCVGSHGRWLTKDESLILLPEGFGND